MEGKGVKTCVDGSSLKGQFEDGHLHGHGMKVRGVSSANLLCGLLRVWAAYVDRLFREETSMSGNSFEEGVVLKFCVLCVDIALRCGEVVVIISPLIWAPSSSLVYLTAVFSRHGFGRYRWCTGDEYVGEWASDRISGSGHMKIGKSSRWVFWLSGFPPTKLWRFARSRGMGAREVVEFRWLSLPPSCGSSHLIGCIHDRPITHDGHIYRGSFVSNERHGRGEGLFCSGLFYSGEHTICLPQK